MLEGSDPTVAPLRRALAVWGLTIDDIGVASFHGTSTKANDKNESSVFNHQFSHLGRTKGNACPVIAQKWLTGHPKGGAAAWMMNGMTQSVLSGIVPGPLIYSLDLSNCCSPDPYIRQPQQRQPVRRDASFRALGLPLALYSDRWH